jgi:hypothetical protein
MVKVYQDFTNQFIVNAERRTPRLRSLPPYLRAWWPRIATLYEYFITDKIGHKQI